MIAKIKRSMLAVSVSLLCFANNALASDLKDAVDERIGTLAKGENLFSKILNVVPNGFALMRYILFAIFIILTLASAFELRKITVAEERRRVIQRFLWHIVGFVMLYSLTLIFEFIG